MPEGKPVDSYPFYVYSGLLTKEHRKRIGTALWEFLWFIDRTTSEIQESGEMVGLVLGGKPLNLSEIAKELGGDRSTIHRNIEKLELEGYISVLRAPYGLIVRVRNSKKWSVAKTQQHPSNWEETVAKTHRPLQKRNGRCENANSNKDKASDKTDDFVIVEDADESINQDCEISDGEGIPTSRHGAAPSATQEPDADSGREKISSAEYRKAVADKYLQRRGKGLDLSPKDLDALDEIIAERVPLRTVLTGIDKAFDDFKPQHSRDEIRGLNFCVPIIFDLHVKQQKCKTDGTEQLPVQSGGTTSKPSFSSGSRKRSGMRPVLPVAKNENQKTASDEDIQRLLQKAQKLKEVSP